MTRSLFKSPAHSDLKQEPLFQSLHSEIDRVFKSFGEFFGDAEGRFETISKGQLIPKVDVSETDEIVEVSAELPGVKEEDIDVTLSDNVLIIKGEKSEKREEKDKDYHLVERSQGKYVRSIPLGFSVSDADVKAELVDGVLKIAITKPAEIAEKTKKIPIGKAA